MVAAKRIQRRDSVRVMFVFLLFRPTGLLGVKMREA